MRIAGVLRRLSLHCVVPCRARSFVLVFAFVIFLLLVVGAAVYSAGSRRVSAQDPTPTPTLEPCSGVCVAGFWDVDYTGSVMGKCQEVLHQSGSSTIWGEISCTHAALGSIAGTLDQSTLVNTGTIEFQQPAFTDYISATYSPDGNSSTATWRCVVGGVEYSGTANAYRIPDHYETALSASSGGQLGTQLGDTLTVPAGALPSDEDVTIDLLALPVAPPEGLKPLPRAYTFGPAGLVFSKPVTVTFQYTQNDLAGGSIDPTTLRVYIYDPEYQVWDLVGGLVDMVGMTVTVQFDHFSTYTILGQPPGAPPLDTATPKPTHTPVPATATHTPRPPTPAPTATLTRSPGVGGIVRLPPDAVAGESHAPASSSWSGGRYAALALGLIAALAALGIGTWYARRRWLT